MKNSKQLIRYKYNGQTGWGIKANDHVLPISTDFGTTGEFLQKGLQLIENKGQMNSTQAIDMEQVEILSPVTKNQQIVCQGINYRDHMIETGVDPDKKSFNMIFRKASSCLCSAYDNIIKPKRVKLLDYEVELGIIIGCDIDKKVEVTIENLHEFIAGIVVFNDVSARDIQIPEGQFFKGKSFRTFAPAGPYLYLLDKDDASKIDELKLELKVNGEIRQQACVADLVIKPHETISELSGIMDFNAGDIIATGTPSGVALKIHGERAETLKKARKNEVSWDEFINEQLDSGMYLQAGDVIEASIKTDDGSIDLGIQHNVVVDEQ